MPRARRRAPTTAVIPRRIHSDPAAAAPADPRALLPAHQHVKARTARSSRWPFPPVSCVRLAERGEIYRPRQRRTQRAALHRRTMHRLVVAAQREPHSDACITYVSLCASRVLLCGPRWRGPHAPRARRPWALVYHLSVLFRSSRWLVAKPVCLGPIFETLQIISVSL